MQIIHIGIQKQLEEKKKLFNRIGKIDSPRALPWHKQCSSSSSRVP